MKFSDIILSLLIIFIFLMCCLVSYLSKGFKHIQNNWPQYRCNPVIMPFAGYFGHDTEENFAQCIGQMQSGVMGAFTADLHAGAQVLNNSISNATNSMSSIRGLQGHLRPAMGGQITNIFGVFQNVLIEFQKFIMGFKDMLMKILGIIATMLYMLSGQNMLGTSIVNGPMMTALKVIGDGASAVGL